MKIFLAGIMQGSHVGIEMHPQAYRAELRRMLETHLPDAEVYDPLADHQMSLDYDFDRGRATFLHHNRMCSETDVLLAFVPQASMGSAIEMWEAWRHGRIVITISPLAHNWTVKFCSSIVYPTLAAFEAELVSGRLARRIDELRAACKVALPLQEGRGAQAGEGLWQPADPPESR
jgi:hypothetical protein